MRNCAIFRNSVHDSYILLLWIGGAGRWGALSSERRSLWIVYQASPPEYIQGEAAWVSLYHTRFPEFKPIQYRFRPGEHPVAKEFLFYPN